MKNGGAKTKQGEEGKAFQRVGKVPVSNRKLSANRSFSPCFPQNLSFIFKPHRSTVPLITHKARLGIAPDRAFFMPACSKNPYISTKNDPDILYQNRSAFLASPARFERAFFRLGERTPAGPALSFEFLRDLLILDFTGFLMHLCIPLSFQNLSKFR